MSVRATATDEHTDAQARIVVSLNYVQVLRREFQAGRLSSTMIENYLARLEAHLLEAERNTAAVVGSNDDEPMVRLHFTDDDRLISERASRN